MHNVPIITENDNILIFYPQKLRLDISGESFANNKKKLVICYNFGTLRVKSY